MARLAPQQQELALIEPGRLSPPIWPCTTRGFPCLVCLQTSGGLLPHRFTLTAESAFADVLQVSLLDATVLHSTGGLFSVALSVNRTARMTCATAPLALPGALPIGSRPCDRKPRCPDFPPVLALRLGPAITWLTRSINYIKCKFGSRLFHGLVAIIPRQTASVRVADFLEVGR